MKHLFFLLAVFSLCAEEHVAPCIHTQHTAILPTGNLRYTATVGKIPLLKLNGEKYAEIFFLSYVVPETQANRPITFVFPGGPGAAGTSESIYAFGPKRMLTVDEGGSILPPYTLIDNPQTLLNVTDLVYVDPVNCGLSRATKETDPIKFCNVANDLVTLQQFVHHYISLFNRWNSPKYLMGSSYGTLRCCGLVDLLLDQDIYVHGLILDGCAFEWASLRSTRDYAIPDCLLIPTFAATAWYHGRLSPEKSLEEVIQEARFFALRQCALQAICPSCFSAAEKAALFQQLSFFTGLPLPTIERYDGRINERIYAAEFFSPERKILGKLDTRYAGDVASIDPSKMGDPSYSDRANPTALFCHYLQNELNYDPSLDDYISLSSEVLQNWEFSTSGSFVPTFLQEIRAALIFNPKLKIFVGAGYYDCRTPFASAEYCFDHIDPAYKKNILFRYYEAGHGLVFDFPSLKKMRADLSAMYIEKEN